MGTTTDGLIVLGILFPEGFVFPWDRTDEDDEDGGDIDDWWRKLCGWKDRVFDWEDASPKAKAQREAWFKERMAFDKEHPLPVELVNVCYIDSPIWILAVPGVGLTASRGDPVVFCPADLAETVDARKVAELIAFCEKYCMGNEDNEPVELVPAWYLGSYWG